jgi:AcrR family transcriptional regulator
MTMATKGVTARVPVVVETVSERVLDAALTCIARVGVTKTTIDDIAREAGCSRATLYRNFSGKQPLLRAVVTRETARLAALLQTETESCGSLGDALVALITAAACYLESLDALQRVLAIEAELILPFVTLSGADVALRRAGEIAAPALAPFVDAEHAARTCEWLARIVLSYFYSPSEFVDLTDSDSVRAFVRDFVAPGPVVVPTPQR